FVPAGTIAAFATTVPRNEFNVETTGWTNPVGQIVKKPSAPEGFTLPGKVAPGGTTVMLNEYARAIDGTGQREVVDCMSNILVVFPVRLGGPKPMGNDPSRVSAMRQGVIPTKTSEPMGVAAKDVASLERALNLSGFATASLSACVGCQYNGACHGLSG